jgi:hypothetical protein
MEIEYEDGDLDSSIENLIKRTVQSELRSFARQVAKATVAEVNESNEPYDFGYSVLTIRFAEGSEPMAISVPYTGPRSRAEINLPLKAIKVEQP